MAEVGRFSQRISLEGLEEIKKGLEEIGLTGSKAFKEVDKAIAASNAQLTGIGRATAAVQAAFVSVGASAKSLGTGVAAVGTAFAGVGTAVAGVTSTLARFGTVALGLGAVGGIAGATAALIGFTKASVEAGDDVNKMSQALGLSVEQYQALSFAAAQAGIDQQQFGRAMSNLNKLIQDGVKEQKKALFDFATSVRAAGGIAIRTLTDNAFQVGASFQQIAEGARNVQRQLQALGIETPLNEIIAQLERLSKTDIGKFELITGITTARTALQQLGLDADKSGNVLLRLGIRLTDATGKIRGTDQIFEDIAEAITKIQDPALRSATLIELFGQRVGPRFASLLSRGRIGVRELKDEFVDLVKGFSPAGAQAAEDVQDAFSSMLTTITNVRNRLAVPLFKPLETAARAVQRAILDNRRAFDEFGQSIARNVIPIIEDFVRLISGQPVETQFFKGLINGAKEVERAFKNIILPAFRAVMSGLEFLAQQINKVFGTELTGAQIGIALFIGQLTGLNNALTQFGIALGILFLALAAHPFVALAIAAVAAIALIILNWERVGPVVQQVSDNIARYNEDAYARATAAANAHFAAVRADFEALGNFIIRVWDRVIERLTRAREIGSSIGGNIPGMEGAPFARGGFVRGPGTATSDSILARLSSGEFVIRAAAVRHFGTEFFAALNALRAPRFNLGGLVEGINRTMARNFVVPGLAMGGPVDAQRGDLRPVIINIGGRQIAGLLAPPDVVKELRRAAISEQYLSAGRKTF